MTITKDTIIGDILTIAPQTAPLFMNIGMHCLGCPASRGETVEQACMVHGVEVDDLLAKVNEMIAAGEEDRERAGAENSAPALFAENPLLRRICPSFGGGARGGGSPPRVGSNALNALHCKAFSERSEDFSAAGRRESNDIFSGCRESPWTFSTAWAGAEESAPVFYIPPGKTVNRP